MSLEKALELAIKCCDSDALSQNVVLYGVTTRNGMVGQCRRSRSGYLFLSWGCPYHLPVGSCCFIRGRLYIQFAAGALISLSIL